MANGVQVGLMETSLSAGIIAATFAFRLPQVYKVWRAKSVLGLNPLSFEVEMYGSAVCLLNGFRRGLPVGLWGEHISNGAQSVLLVALIYLYPGSPTPLALWRKCGHGLAVVSVYAAGLGGALPSPIIYTFYNLQNVAVMLSRLGQARTNWRRGGTGQLSATTRLAMLCGNLARIYTTLRNRAGAAMLFGHASSALANGILVAQCAWYTDWKGARRGSRGPQPEGSLTPVVLRRLARTKDEG